MTRFQKQSRRTVIAFAFIGAASLASVPVLKADRPEAGDETITAEMFTAMDAGQIDVKYIPLDATKANILITNTTDKPMRIKLPESFAGVPALGQFGGGMGGGGMGGGGMGGGGGQQAGGGGGGGGDDGGFLNVPAERMRKVATQTVCLEHGKQDPNPRVAYKIVPLEHFTTDPRMRLVCTALGNGKIGQNTAQAVAWHLMDGLSWETLAAKNRKESKYTGNERWFSPRELQDAMKIVDEANRKVEASSESENGSYES